MAQIAALRKDTRSTTENGSSDVAEPSQIKASDVEFRGEIRAQERRLVDALFQGDRCQNSKMAEEFQRRQRRVERLSPQEC